MAIADVKLLTAEEFGLLPNPRDGSQQELVRGEIIELPPPKALHGAVCFNVAMAIGMHLRANPIGRAVCNDSGCVTETDPDTVRGIDVAYYSFKRLPTIPKEYVRVPPEIAVEVLSPGNDAEDMREKTREYLAMGVTMVWIVDPELRSVTIYRTPDEGRVLHHTATLTCEDVLPGFACPVATFFEGL